MKKQKYIIPEIEASEFNLERVFMINESWEVDNDEEDNGGSAKKFDSFSEMNENYWEE